jgi:membrane fusion protein, multidrug efflux system
LSKRRITIILIVILGLVVGGFLAFYLNQPNFFTSPQPAGSAPAGPGTRGPGGPGGPGGPVAVEVSKVEQINLEDSLTAVGSLLAAESVLVKSEIAGRIAVIGFTDGQQVKRGQSLIEFDSAIQSAQLSQARAERDLADARLRRAQELFDQKFLSAAARDDAKAAQQIAVARLELAQANLDKTKLIAPFDGVIGIRQVSVGDYIKEGVELVSLEDTRSMKVDFRVPEQISSRLRVGQTLKLQVDALPGKTFTGRVSALDSAIDVAGRSLLIRAVLTNSGQQLRPGMFARVQLLLSARPAALVVPEEAIVTDQSGQFVLKVVEDKAVRQPVKTGLRTTHSQRAVVEITQGLTAEDTVIIAGQIKIRANNTPVKIIAPASASNMAPSAPGARGAAAPAAQKP